jgi:hypothetical protein
MALLIIARKQRTENHKNGKVGKLEAMSDETY